MKSTVSLAKLLKVGLFANIIEWYEFSVYGYLSAIIGQLFFKETSSFLALINAFSLVAIRFLARPLGSLFFGHFADKHGRNASLKLSLMMMSIPTILIGLLPTYQVIGYWSTGLLLILGLIQGFAAGGEFPISACYLFENAPRQHRSLLCCSASIGNVIGFLCGSAVSALLFGCLARETIEAWAWRIPFLLGIPLTVWIAKIRRSLPNATPHASLESSPITVIWKKQKKPLLVGIGLSAFVPAIGAQMLSVWMPFYLNHFLNYPETMVYYLNTAGIISSILFSCLAAYLVRFIPLHTLVKSSALSIFLLAYPLIIHLQDTSWPTLLMILITFKFLISLTGGIIIEMLGMLFSETRSLGMSITFSLPAAVFGGMTPLVCTYMTKEYGLSFPAFYCMGFAVMAWISATQFPSTIPSNDNH